MIDTLTINNFRGLKHVDLSDLKRINLFVGKNNSGKTSILEAIFLNIGAINPELDVRINAFREHTKFNDSTFRSFFTDFDITEPIEINAVYKNPKQYRNLSITPDKNKDVKGKILNLNEVESHINTSLNTHEIIGLNHLLNYKESSKGKFKEYKSYIKRNNNGGVEIQTSQNFNETIKGIFIQPRKSFIDNSSRLSRIKLMKKESKVINILQKIEPSLKRIEILENNSIYADIGKQNLIPFNLLGDGINRLLTIILAIFDNENGVLLIDEIENGFHYKALEILWNAIIEITNEFNVQVFATTHSWENISTFSNVYNTLKFEDLALYRIENHENKIQTFTYDSNLLIDTLESNWELR